MVEGQNSQNNLEQAVASVQGEGVASDGAPGFSQEEKGFSEKLDILNEEAPKGASNDSNSLEAILARNSRDRTQEADQEAKQEALDNSEPVEYGLPETGSVDGIEAAPAKPVTEVVKESHTDTAESTQGEPIIKELKEGELPVLKKSDKPGFNPMETQSPLQKEEVEGGVVASRTTGPTMSASNPGKRGDDEGFQLKPKADMQADSPDDKYELTGFTVEYEAGGENYSVEIRDFFDDIETAQASINSGKYLMPMKNGFKVTNIKGGMPTLSYDERQMYEFKGNKWQRT